MRTALKRSLHLGSVTTLLALATPACVDNNVTLFVKQVQVPDPGNSCAVMADPGAMFYGTGVLDTALSVEYGGTLLLGNQMTPRGDSATLRPESSRIQVYEAEVEVFNSGGATLNTFSIPASGFVDVGSGSEPGWGLARVTLVDAASGSSVGAGRQTLISRVKIYGLTLGDIDVETGYFDFPIEVCRDCLPCVCPSSADDKYAPACNLGQNEGGDCRLRDCWTAAAGYCGCTGV